MTLVYDVLEAGDSHSGRSLLSHLGALYTQVGERLKVALHTGVKHVLAMVSLHYLGVDLPAVSEGYVIGDDKEEAKEEVKKPAEAAEAPRDTLATLLELEVTLPPLILQGRSKVGPWSPCKD